MNAKCKEILICDYRTSCAISKCVTIKVTVEVTVMHACLLDMVPRRAERE